MIWKKYSEEKPPKCESVIIINSYNDICFGEEWEFCWACSHEKGTCTPNFWILASDIPRPNQPERLSEKTYGND